MKVKVGCLYLFTIEYSDTKKVQLTLSFDVHVNANCSHLNYHGERTDFAVDASLRNSPMSHRH